MDYSTAFDILFLLAAVYFWPGVPGQRSQSPYAQRQGPARASLAVPSTPKSPTSPVPPTEHARKTSFAGTLAVPKIVLHAEPQEAKPIIRKQQHKRKSVSFSISSMADLDPDRKQPLPSPHGQHRPPTPFHRAPPTPSELLALASASPKPTVPRIPHYEDVPTPLTADMVVSKEVTDPMGVKKGWLV